MERTELLLVNVSFIYYLFPIFLVAMLNIASGMTDAYNFFYTVIGAIAIILLIDAFVILFHPASKVKTFAYKTYAGLICVLSAYLVVDYLTVRPTWYLFVLPVANLVSAAYILYDVRKKFGERPHYIDVVLGLVVTGLILWLSSPFAVAMSLSLIYAMIIHKHTTKYIKSLFLHSKNPA